MQMMMHHRESADRRREYLCKSLQPALEPLLEITLSFADESGAAEAARDAVIPGCYGHVDQMRASHRHGRTSR
jgi:hypothetical protein